MSARRRGDEPDPVDQLFSNPPAGFVAERNRLARELRTAGQRAAAAEVAALRRPTQSAWVVNLLARRRGQLLEQLLDIGGALRAAQAELDGAALKALSGNRRAVIDALVRDGVRLAEGEGLVAEATLRGEVQATLDAALSDPDLGEQVKAGRLSRPFRHAGFGPIGTAPVASGVRRAPEPAGAAAARRAAVEEARRSLAWAEEHLAAAVAGAETGAAAAQEWAARERELRDQLGDAQRRLAEAALEARQAQRHRDEAEQAVVRARRGLATAQARLKPSDET